eukprot:m.163511 g.163511  ORF g.163511 m.163511 type:complete len:465 (-) comp17691_c0_seq6:1223-2617(-)
MAAAGQVPDAGSLSTQQIRQEIDRWWPPPAFDNASGTPHQHKDGEPEVRAFEQRLATFMARLEESLRVDPTAASGSGADTASHRQHQPDGLLGGSIGATAPTSSATADVDLAVFAAKEDELRHRLNECLELEQQANLQTEANQLVRQVEQHADALRREHLVSLRQQESRYHQNTSELQGIVESLHDELRSSQARETQKIADVRAFHQLTLSQRDREYRRGLTQLQESHELEMEALRRQQAVESGEAERQWEHRFSHLQAEFAAQSTELSKIADELEKRVRQLDEENEDKQSQLDTSKSAVTELVSKLEAAERREEQYSLAMKEAALSHTRALSAMKAEFEMSQRQVTDTVLQLQQRNTSLVKELQESQAESDNKLTEAQKSFAAATNKLETSVAKHRAEAAQAAAALERGKAEHEDRLRKAMADGRRQVSNSNTAGLQGPIFIFVRCTVFRRSAIRCATLTTNK